MGERRYLAFDIGAESGRAVVGTLADDRLSLEEIHRFANQPVEVCDTLHWDVLAIHANVLQGIREYVRRFGDRADGIAVDTWALDFGLLASDGKLLQNPVAYRDRRTEGMVEKALARMPAEELYAHTGLNILPIHTLFQLLALRASDSPLLEVATRFLMMPDLIAYFLTGRDVCERTNAITTQVYDPRSGEWSRRIFETFQLPLSIMPELVDPATVLGELREPVREATGLAHAPVVAACTHDTGSAVAAVPGRGDDWAFISSGTWSVLGALTDQVVTCPEAQAAHVCNELTLGSRFICRNIMGLWLLQQSREAWRRGGREYSHEDLVGLAERAPDDSPIVDPDDLTFLAPQDMPAAIRDYCARTGQAPPDGPAAVTRCILASLALSYREGLERLSRILGRAFGAVHVVGGGSRNRLLCQLTANATGLPVRAGPVEATAAANVLAQALATGDLGSLSDIREVVRRSTDLIEYAPGRREASDARYETFVGLRGRSDT